MRANTRTRLTWAAPACPLPRTRSPETLCPDARYRVKARAGDSRCAVEHSVGRADCCSPRKHASGLVCPSPVARSCLRPDASARFHRRVPAGDEDRARWLALGAFRFGTVSENVDEDRRWLRYALAGRRPCAAVLFGIVSALASQSCSPSTNRSCLLPGLCAGRWSVTGADEDLGLVGLEQSDA